MDTGSNLIPPINAARVLVCGEGRWQAQAASSSAWGQLLRSGQPPVIRRLSAKRPAGADLLMRCVYSDGQSIEVGVAVLDGSDLGETCHTRLRALYATYHERAVVLMSAMAMTTHTEEAEAILLLIRDSGKGLRFPLLFHPNAHAETAPWTAMATACSIFTSDAILLAVTGGDRAPTAATMLVRQAMKLASTGAGGDSIASLNVSKVAGSEVAGIEAILSSHGSCVAGGLGQMLAESL